MTGSGADLEYRRMLREASIAEANAQGFDAARLEQILDSKAGYGIDDQIMSDLLKNPAALSYLALKNEVTTAVGGAVNNVQDSTVAGFLSSPSATRTGTDARVTSVGTSLVNNIVPPLIEVSGRDWRSAWANQAMLPPRPMHIPKVTVTDTATSTLTNPVIYRPIIVGTGSQVTDWNGQDDPNIRFGGGAAARFNTANGANNDLAMYSKLKPGGASQAADWPLIYEINTTAPSVEFSTYAKIGSAFLIEVDDHLIAQEMFTNWKFAAGSATARLDFLTPGYNGIARNIRIIATGGQGLREIRVPETYTITKPAARTSVIGLLGDSWTTPLTSFLMRIARMINPRADFVNLGIGGTGWVAGGATNAYYTRTAAMLECNPGLILAYGSQNDGNNNIQAAVESTLDGLSTVPKIVGISTLLGGHDTQVNSVAAAFAAKNRTFVDVRAFIQGTGAITTPQLLNGNRSLFINSNADLHMPYDGDRMAAEAIFRALPNIVVR